MRILSVIDQGLAGLTGVAGPRPGPAPERRPTPPTPTPISAADPAAAAGRRAAPPLGDPDAFRDLVARLSARLVRFLERFLGDHGRANDLTQEAFLRLHQRLQTVTPELAAADPTALLYTIAANLGRDELRRRKIRREKPFAGMLERSAEGPRPEDALERDEDQRQVRDALARLDADKRLLLILRDVEGLGYERIGEILEVPIGTVKSRISRARLAFRDLWTASGGEGGR